MYRDSGLAIDVYNLAESDLVPLRHLGHFKFSRWDLGCRGDLAVRKQTFIVEHLGSECAAFRTFRV